MLFLIILKISIVQLFELFELFDCSFVGLLDCLICSMLVCSNCLLLGIRYYRRFLVILIFRFVHLCRKSTIVEFGVSLRTKCINYFIAFAEYFVVVSDVFNQKWSKSLNSLGLYRLKNFEFAPIFLVSKIPSRHLDIGLWVLTLGQWFLDF